MCLIHLLGQHLIDAPPFPFIHSEFESTHIPTFHRTIFQAFFEIRFHLKYLIHHWSVSAEPRLRWSAIPFAHWPSSRHHYWEWGYTGRPKMSKFKNSIKRHYWLGLRDAVKNYLADGGTSPYPLSGKSFCQKTLRNWGKPPPFNGKLLKIFLKKWVKKG